MAVAALVALVLLLVAVLPAEYGLDPTGVGDALGLTQMSGETAAPTNDTGTAQSTVFVYRLTWPIRMVVLEPRSGYTARGATTNLYVPLETLNLTRVTARLSWDDANATAGQRTEPDLFELQVIGPDGSAGEADLGRNGADGKGNVSAALTWRPAPSPQPVRAENDEGAQREAERLVDPDRSAFGEWTIRISLIEAGGMGLPLGGSLGDEGNDWQLVLAIESFWFDTSSLDASKLREDRVRLELAPGTGLEYKFDLEEGALLEYAWNTTGAPLHYDFHGERRGDTSGAFTSHKRGSGGQDSGSFNAPFSGTHGWYWENTGTEPASVELTTSGVYKIIGKK